MATNCCEFPAAIEEFAGVTAMDINTGAVTINGVEPVIPVSVALMLDVPVETPVAKPLVAIVATPEADELHATVLVRFSVLPSV